MVTSSTRRKSLSRPDIATLESLSWVSCGLFEAEGVVISESDISGIPGLMQLISTGRFPDNALTLAAAEFDEGIAGYDLGEYVTGECRGWDAQKELLFYLWIMG